MWLILHCIVDTPIVVEDILSCVVADPATVELSLNSVPSCDHWYEKSVVPSVAVAYKLKVWVAPDATVSSAGWVTIVISGKTVSVPIPEFNGSFGAFPVKTPPKLTEVTPEITSGT